MRLSILAILLFSICLGCDRSESGAEAASTKPAAGDTQESAATPPASTPANASANDGAQSGDQAAEQSGAGEQEPSSASPSAAASGSGPEFGPDGGISDEALADYLVSMDITIDGEEVGTMVFEFWPEKAPVSVRNFLRHAATGFYDGVGFHRIMKGFMIQGGDPTGTGSGQGKFGQIPGEFATNPNYDKRELAKDPKYNHVYGVLSMARGSSPDSGSCQFFICNDAPSFLDGNYASFGKMTSGKEVLDRISNVPTTASPRGEKSVPTEEVVMKDVSVHRKG